MWTVSFRLIPKYCSFFSNLSYILIWTELLCAHFVAFFHRSSQHLFCWCQGSSPNGLQVRETRRAYYLKSPRRELKNTTPLTKHVEFAFMVQRGESSVVMARLPEHDLRDTTRGLAILEYSMFESLNRCCSSRAHTSMPLLLRGL